MYSSDNLGKEKEGEKSNDNNTYYNNDIYYNNNNPAPPQEKPLDMKWFKFLINFALWVGAVLNLLDGLTIYNHSEYLSQGITVADIDRVFPGLRPLDEFIGLCIIGLAVFQIVTRFFLANYSSKGPKMLYAVYIISIVINILYCILVKEITGIDVASSIISTVITQIVMLIININYFNKRKHLFVD